jgi:hypothetical protein
VINTGIGITPYSSRNIPRSLLGARTVPYTSRPLINPIYCVNPRYVKNKTISLCDYVLSNDFDMVAVTETWLGSNVDETCISGLVPNGYTMKQGIYRIAKHFLCDSGGPSLPNG